MKTDVNTNACIISTLVKPASQSRYEGKVCSGNEKDCITSDISATDDSESAKAGKAFADTLKDKISPKNTDSKNKTKQDSDETSDAAVNLTMMGVVVVEPQPQITNATSNDPATLEVSSQAVEQLQPQISGESIQQANASQTPAAAAIPAVVSTVKTETELVLPEISEMPNGIIPPANSESNTQAQQLKPDSKPAISQNPIPSQNLAAGTPVIDTAVNAEIPANDTENAADSSTSVNQLINNILDSVGEQPSQSSPRFTSPVLTTAYAQKTQAAPLKPVASKTKSQTSDAAATDTIEPLAESDIDIDTAIDVLPQEQLTSKNILPQTTRQTDLNQDSSFGSEVSAQAIAGNTQQTVGKDFPAASTTAVTSEIHDKNLSSSIREQVSNFIQTSHQSGGQQISFRLNPANMGSVTVNFQENADGISGTLQVNQLQTKDEIQRAIPEMIRNLGEAGIHIKKLEVVLTNQQSYDNAKDQSFAAGQDSNPSQQNSSESRQASGGTTQNQWKTNIANSSEFNQQQGYHTDNSINMLA